MEDEFGIGIAFLFAVMNENFLVFSTSQRNDIICSIRADGNSNVIIIDCERGNCADTGNIEFILAAFVAADSNFLAAVFKEVFLLIRRKIKRAIDGSPYKRHAIFACSSVNGSNARATAVNRIAFNIDSALCAAEQLKLSGRIFINIAVFSEEAAFI